MRGDPAKQQLRVLRSLGGPRGAGQLQGDAAAQQTGEGVGEPVATAAITVALLPQLLQQMKCLHKENRLFRRQHRPEIVRRMLLGLPLVFECLMMLQVLHGVCSAAVEATAVAVPPPAGVAAAAA